LLTRLERNLVLVVSVALVLVTIGNTLLMARGHAISLYLKSRDVAVIGFAAVMIAGNVVAMRRNTREARLFMVVVGLFSIVGLAHLLRLLHGGFLCR
jgi:hypothetical protein